MTNPQVDLSKLPKVQTVLPKVVLVATPNFNALDFPYEFDSLGDESVSPGGKLVEVGGRVCYMSFGDKQGRRDNQSYIQHMINAGHCSVLEHANYTFLLEGISRSLMHELVQHRAGFTYSQRSPRYVDESDVAFVMPPELLDAHEGLQGLFLIQCAVAKAAYSALVLALEPVVEASYDADKKELLKQSGQLGEMKRDIRKRVRQTARSVLPNATETKILVTANARAWRHFLNMRGNPAAASEIRRLSALIGTVLREFANPLFDDVEIEEGQPAPTTRVTWPKP